LGTVYCPLLKDHILAVGLLQLAELNILQETLPTHVLHVVYK
jgi:hypothetical protein